MKILQCFPQLARKMKRRLFLVAAITLSISNTPSSGSTVGLHKKAKNALAAGLKTQVLEDAFLTTVQLIEKYGYPVENHTVHTEDGYMLELHRIPRPGAIPVLFIHGFSMCSASAVLMGPAKGLGYLLYDEGYDVWLGNVRGVRYSQRHEYMNKTMEKFWNFTLHEIGIYDLPAFIDFILDSTGFEKIHYIGYSQGTAAFWIMCSQREVYNEKIITMNALAPVAFLGHTRSPALRILVALVHQIDALFELTGHMEFLPTNKFNVLFNKFACAERASLRALCGLSIASFGGFNSKQTNFTSLPIISGHVPAGVSTKQILHFAQLAESGKFAFFDFGIVENLVKYGSLKPPVYNLKKVKVPVALHYSLNDWLSVPRDVRKLAKILPNVLELHLVLDPDFAHMDFMFAIEVKKLVYDKVISLMRSAEDH